MYISIFSVTNTIWLVIYNTNYLVLKATIIVQIKLIQEMAFQSSLKGSWFFAYFQT